MKRRIRDIPNDISAGIKKWAEVQYEILRTRREDLRLHKLSKQFVLLNNIRIYMYDDENSSMIVIRGGCEDLKGFILNREGTLINPVDYAYFQSGSIEEIGAKSSPHVKNYVVPAPDLTDSFSTRKTASRFSGLMRLVVGCYHDAAKNAPFSYTWAITHGIVHDPNGKYWLVEVSSNGVFAAPITYKGKCCDSWDVTDYQPTDEELAQNPGWQQYRTTTSLWWAVNFGSRTAVKQLISGTTMNTYYTQGDPWFAGQGWAFSGTGMKARGIVQAAVSTPESHYEMNQFELTFGNDAVGDLTAAIAQLDTNAVYTPLLSAPLWVPSGSDWAGVDAVSPSGPEVTQYPSQNAPVFVYFDGEDAIETRWQLFKGTVAAFTSAPIAVKGGFIFWNTTHIGMIEPNVPGFSCYASSGIWTSDYPNQIRGGTGVNDAAYNELTFGFTSPRTSKVGSGHSRSRQTFTTAITETVIEHVEFNNFYGLDPSCYFFDGGGHLITACTSTFGYDNTYFWTQNAFKTYTESMTFRCAIAFFAEDREAVLTIGEQAQQDSGTQDIFAESKARFEQDEYKVDAGPCPLTSVTIHFIQGGFGSRGSNQLGVTLDESSLVGTAQLDIGRNEHSANATFDGFGGWVNYNLGTFLDFNPTTKPTAESNVFAMHGNMNTVDKKLLPTDQRDNRVVILDDTLEVYTGFSEPQGEVVAFVGKA